MGEWGCLGADAGTLLPSSGIMQAVWRRREQSHKVPGMSDMPVQIDFTVILCGVLSSLPWTEVPQWCIAACAALYLGGLSLALFLQCFSTETPPGMPENSWELQECGCQLEGDAEVFVFKQIGLILPV